MIYLSLMAALGIYLIITIGIVTAVVLRLRKHSWKNRLAAALGTLLVMWLIPCGDHMVGKVYMDRLCAYDGGLRVYKTVENVEGYLINFVPARGSKGAHLDKLYRYYESPAPGEMVDRIWIDERGIGFREDHDVQSIARYSIMKSDSSLPMYLHKSTYTVEDMQLRERLAAYTEYGYRGGWVSRALSGIGGLGGGCPDENFSLSNLRRTVLKPVEQKGR